MEDDAVSLKHHGLSPPETTAIAQALKVCVFFLAM